MQPPLCPESLVLHERRFPHRPLPPSLLLSDPFPVYSIRGFTFVPSWFFRPVGGGNSHTSTFLLWTLSYFYGGVPTLPLQVRLRRENMSRCCHASPPADASEAVVQSASRRSRINECHLVHRSIREIYRKRGNEGNKYGKRIGVGWVICAVFGRRAARPSLRAKREYAYEILCSLLERVATVKISSPMITMGGK